MKLFQTLKHIILEYIHPEAEVLYSTTMNEKSFIFYDSPHIYEKRKGYDKVRLTDKELLLDMIKLSVPKLYNKYYNSGRRFREIESDDPKKSRFAIRRKTGKREPAAIIQIDEFIEDKGFIFVVITFFDEKGENLKNMTNKMRTRFILDI
jgi:hypothetical protein